MPCPLPVSVPFLLGFSYQGAWLGGTQVSPSFPVPEGLVANESQPLPVMLRRRMMHLISSERRLPTCLLGTPAWATPGLPPAPPGPLCLFLVPCSGPSPSHLPWDSQTAYSFSH